MSTDQSKTHVLHLIGSTGLYGAERWILALVGAIDPNLIKSTIVNLVDKKGERSAIVEAAQQRGLDALDFYTGGAFNPLSVFRLARWARKRKVHIMHGHGFKSDAIGLLTARLARCKAMTTPHGWSLEADRRLQFYEKLDRNLLRFMDKVCPLSLDLAEGIKGLASAAKIDLIFNGVDIDEVKAAPAADRTDGDNYLIGYIGQLIARKDLQTLLQAVKLLSAKQPNVRLMMIGDGAKKEDLQEEAKCLGITSQVDFLGFRPDAASYLKIFDVFVLPSLMEGIPRCIMEAMAASLPVVVSDIPGNRCLVSHGETGLIFAPGDSADLVEKITYLMDHPDHAGKMAVSGNRKVEDGYSSRKMAIEYCKLYQELKLL